MKIILLTGIITRQYIQDHTDWLFLFGDNNQRIGFGGQAKEFRGEQNIWGIRTKQSPSEFFDDYTIYKNGYGKATAREWIQWDFALLKTAPFKGQTLREGEKEYTHDVLVIPVNPQYITDLNPHGISIGCGLAKMPEKCPEAFEYMMNKFNELIENAESVERMAV